MGSLLTKLHQTTIMKFVALALALLLAVGSQGASLMQADAPSQLAHVRAAMDVYLTQVKESAKRALDQLDDTEYKELKEQLSQRLEDMHTQIKTLQTSVSPVTDGIVKTISDATAGFRAAVEADLETLRTKLEPIMEELRAKIAVNLEETKAAMAPIVEAVRTKVSERLEELKTMAKPYVDEYKDQARQMYDQAKSIKTEDLTALKEKIAPLAEEVKTKLQQIMEIVIASFQS